MNPHRMLPRFERTVEQLFEALDRGLLRGEEPQSLLQLACSHLEKAFGYPVVALRAGAGGGRAPMTVAAGGAVGRLASDDPPQLAWGDWEAAGVGVAVALPVRLDHRLVASLHVFSRADEFRLTELHALGAIARRIAVLMMVCLNQQQLRLQSTALSSAVNAVFITDRDGTIQWVNSAFTRMTGYAAAEAIGQNPRILKSGSHGSDFFREVWATVRVGRPWEGEVVERHRDGHRYVVHQTITPIKDEHGAVTHYVAIHEDVTERKALERELRAARDHALESARLKSEFLANISHEVRTPMNGVLGMLELLADTPLEPEQRHYLEVARRSARTLLGSLNDILDYSRLESVGVRLDPADVDLFSACDEALELMAGSAGDKGLELYYRIDPALDPWVRLDPVRLRQVLGNLIGNAVKFTERGEVVLSVEPGRESGTLRFSVRDTGVGIPPEARERIFEAFQQADGSSTRRYGGSGLGLAICRQIVTQMGGAIGVESKPGEGSCFWFTLRTEAPLGRRRGDARLIGQRLLLVEGRAALAGAVAAMGRSLGALVEVAEDAGTGLRRLREARAAERPYTAVLLAEALPDAAPEAVAEHMAHGGERLVPFAAPGARNPLCSGGRSCLHRPLARAQLAACLSPDARPAGAEGRVQPVGRVLVVEDNPVNQQVTGAMLARLGLEYAVAGDGREALERVLEEPFDLVVMDCQMPVMDGYQAAGRMRRREREEGRARIPIVAMTAHARPDEAERCAAAEMDGYIAKPLELESLRQTLLRFLQRPLAPVAAAVQAGRGVLDARALAQLQEVDADDAARIVEAFLADTPPRLAQLHEALAAGDHEAAVRVAHTLKGSSTALGVRELAELCAEVERTARAGDRVEGGLVERARELFAAARTELEAFAAQLT